MTLTSERVPTSNITEVYETRTFHNVIAKEGIYIYVCYLFEATPCKFRFEVTNGAKETSGRSKEWILD